MAILEIPALIMTTGLAGGVVVMLVLVACIMYCSLKRKKDNFHSLKEEDIPDEISEYDIEKEPYIERRDSLEAKPPSLNTEFIPVIFSDISCLPINELSEERGTKEIFRPNC